MVLKKSLLKISKFHLISWCRNFVDWHNFYTETVPFNKFPQQKIRRNYGILRSEWILNAPLGDFPADIYLLKVNNRNIRTMASFWCLYCKLWTYFTPCYSVSIVNFEQVNVGWVLFPSKWIFSKEAISVNMREREKLPG